LAGDGDGADFDGVANLGDIDASVEADFGEHQQHPALVVTQAGGGAVDTVVGADFGVDRGGDRGRG
jgi:hypothetical protein